MIAVTDRLSIDEDEIVVRHARASGPGGQHVNKTSTAIELRFDVRGSASLPEDVRQRLERLAGSRLTNDGVTLHASHVLNGYASHGCVGLPLAFAKKLYGITHLGDKVIITDGKQASVGGQLN